MAIKSKVDGFLNDMKSIASMPLFTLSPARKISKEDGEGKNRDEKMKTKFLEAWNNIRYDLGSGATLKKDVPIWILGVCHHSKSILSESCSGEEEEEMPFFDTPLAKQVFTDFASRPWFTYRKNFPPIPGTDITTDTGWGCMLRSAQMMVAQGLLLHFLGREWRWLQRQNHHENHVHRKILGWFIDDPGEHCPLSVQHLSTIGRKYGNVPGNWYGPNTVAYIMQQAVKAAQEKVHELRDIAIYVAQDCTIYSEDVYDLCGWRNNPESTEQRRPSTDSASSSCTSSASEVYIESVDDISSEIYIDEIAKEASETPPFFVPRLTAEEGISSSKVVNNMIPMAEFKNSDNFFSNIQVEEPWTKMDDILPAFTDLPNGVAANKPTKKRPGKKTSKLGKLVKNKSKTSRNADPYIKKNRTESWIEVSGIETSAQSCHAPDHMTIPVVENVPKNQNLEPMADIQPVLSSENTSPGHAKPKIRLYEPEPFVRKEQTETAERVNVPRDVGTSSASQNSIQNSRIRDLLQGIASKTPESSIPDENFKTTVMPGSETGTTTLKTPVQSDIASVVMQGSSKTAESGQKSAPFEHSRSKPINKSSPGRGLPENIAKNDEIVLFERTTKCCHIDDSAPPTPHEPISESTPASASQRDASRTLGNQQHIPAPHSLQVTSPQSSISPHTSEGHSEFRQGTLPNPETASSAEHLNTTASTSEKSMLFSSSFENHSEESQTYAREFAADSLSEREEQTTHPIASQNRTKSPKKRLVPGPEIQEFNLCDNSVDIMATHQQNFKNASSSSYPRDHGIMQDAEIFSKTVKSNISFKGQENSQCEILDKKHSKSPQSPPPESFFQEFLSAYVEKVMSPRSSVNPKDVADSSFPYSSSHKNTNIISQRSSSLKSSQRHSSSSSRASPVSFKSDVKNPEISSGKHIDIPRKMSSKRRPRSSTLDSNVGSTMSPPELLRIPRKSSTKSKSSVHPASTSFKAALILVPVRLGESSLNPIYAPCVQSVLSLESSVGIMGGKPKHSLYFVGFQGENLLHLDPHYCQPADTPMGFKKNLHDYHTMSVRKINVKKIDPSCCFGFYCRTPQEFEQFKLEGQKIFSPPQQPISYPMCIIMDGRSGDHHPPTGFNSPTDMGNMDPSMENVTSMSINATSDDIFPSPAKSSSPGSKARGKSPKKPKNDYFNIDEMGSKLHKLNPFPKFMRQKSSSPTFRRKAKAADKEEESLESQFELL